MNRTALRIALDVVLTIVLSIALITLWLFIFTGNVADSIGEAARLLFLFMDVGLVLWVVLLIVSAVRSRGARPDIGWTLLFAIIGAIVNLVVVAIVGFIQGGWAPLLVLFAIEAGIAFLLAAVIAVLLVHRVIVKPRATV
jgi:hypothetical protein